MGCFDHHSRAAFDSEELYDQARWTDQWMTEFWHITLPLLRPTWFSSGNRRNFLWGLFAQPQLLTDVVPCVERRRLHILYDQGFQYHKFGYASAVAVVLSIIMFISSFLNILLLDMRLN